VCSSDLGEGVQPAPPAKGLTITDEGDVLRVDTGPLVFTLSRTNGRVIEEARRGDRLIKPASDVWDLALVDESGRAVRSGGATVTETQVVDKGPLRALIVRQGSFADEKGKLVDYRLTVEATAGSDRLRVEATIINREDASEVYLKRWSLQLARSGAAQAKVRLGPGETRAANVGAVLYQHNEKLLTWTGADGARTRQPGQAPGFVRMPGLAAGTRWFWQRYPQAIRFDADAVRFDFLPEPLDDGDLPTRWRDRMREQVGGSPPSTDRYTVGGVGYPQAPGKMGLFRLAQGEALSQEMMFVLDGQDAADSDAGKDAGAPRTDEATFVSLVAPLRAAPDPAYAAGTRAFGEFAAADPLKYPRYEQTVESCYKGYLAQREKRREWGFENFGDDTFEWGYGPSYTYWSNSEYDHHHGFALQYLRSADPRWWTLAEETARQYRDICVCHHAPPGSYLMGGPHHHNATTVWMPQDPEQFWIADHTAAGASAGHSWVEGMIGYWYLTGDPWAEEVVKELAGWYCEEAEHGRYDPGGQERGPGWALIAISALNNALGGERLQKAGWTIANWLLDWQDPIRGVVSIPISEQPSYEGGSTFMHGIVGRGLGRWYDVTGDPRVKDAAIGIAEWMTTEPMGKMGTFWYKQSPQNSRSYGADSQCLTALTYAYVLSRDPWFAEVATVLMEQSGANDRALSWYPQSLAHLLPLVSPAEVKAGATGRSPLLVMDPTAPGETALTIRDTTGQPLTAELSAAILNEVKDLARGARSLRPDPSHADLPVRQLRATPSTPPPFTVTLPPRVDVAAGATASVPLRVTAKTAPAKAELELTVRLKPAHGEPVTRTLRLSLESVPKVARLRVTAAQADLTAPMVLAGTGDQAYVHTPRGPDFVEKPRPNDGVSGGLARWTVEVPAEGEYTCWAEVQWLDEGGNSFSIRFDGGPEQLLGNTGAIGPWVWIEGPRVRLPAGKHTIQVRTREDGSRLRRFVLTSVPDDRPGG
jgi:hypothetical protein